MMGEPCESADKNPFCPYITQIQQQGKDIVTIKKALVGDDMQGGIVAEIHKFKMLWGVALFLGGAAFTGFFALALGLIK